MKTKPGEQPDRTLKLYNRLIRETDAGVPMHLRAEDGRAWIEIGCDTAEDARLVAGRLRVLADALERSADVLSGPAAETSEYERATNVRPLRGR